MRWFALCLLFVGTAVHARDAGQWGDVDPSTGAWFKSVRSPQGIPCCDIADGHPVDAEYRADRHWWAYFEGEWHVIPDEAVVRGAANPMGRAIAWYVRHPEGFYIRCFVSVTEG